MKSSTISSAGPRGAVFPPAKSASGPDSAGPAPSVTYLDVIEALATDAGERGFTFVSGDGSEKTIGFRALGAEVARRGRQLLSAGVSAGDRVALVIPEPDQFILSFLGAVSAGLVPVPLYPPLALSKIDTYLEATRNILQAASADLLVTTVQVEKVLWSIVPRVPSLRDLVTVEKLRELPEKDAPRPTVRPEDPVFLQFTSGSTAAPKGVVVTHASLLANATAIVNEGLQATGDRDVAVSWLPLYHDMGLIGFVLAPLINRIPVVYIPTLSFVRRPALWMEVIHRHRATITFAPNFAFARITKRASDADLARWDLSSLRIVGCGAEPIHPATMRAFVERMSARCGLNPKAMLPCYGMAEATLAITFIGLEEELTTDKHGNGELVSCGRPFSGHEIGIFDDDGRRLPDGETGEIRLRGPSVAAGYFRDEKATRQAFLEGGWLRTGDLGYLKNGELYISGRQKDLLIIHGRNYYPQAIEWQCEEVAGIRKGNVVAFSVPGAETEEIVIVAETGEIDPEKRVEIAAKVKSHLSGALSLAASDVVLLGVGELPKTTSGKLQRRKTREQYLARTLGREGVRTAGGAADRLALARHLVVGFASRMTHRARAFWPFRRK